MKMKTIVLVCAAVLLLGLVAGCGAGTASSPTAAPVPTETAEATANPTANSVTFTVGFDAEFPPFGFIADDGSYDGFDLACAKEVCQRLGWKFVAQPIDWNAKDAELSSGNIDCIWNGFTINGRENDYTWTTPYYDNSIVVVVRADSGIKALSDLSGKTVMVQTDSSALAALNSEDNASLLASLGNVLEEADYNTGFMDLGQGTVDAVAVDVGVANYQLSANSGNFVILDQPVSSEQYAVGFLKGNTEMASTVDTVLKQMADDGTMAQIAQKYVSYGLVPQALCLCK
jgi:polar amino acid transport system substrate-binding protein